MDVFDPVKTGQAAEKASREQIWREAWNARGVADTKAVEERLATLTGWITSEPYRQHLAEAIKAVDVVSAPGEPTHGVLHFVPGRDDGFKR